MADFKKAFEVLKKLEYRDCSNALHKNPGEDGYTFMGIYQKAHPNCTIWRDMRNYFYLLDIEGEPTKEQLGEVSKLMCGNANVVDEVHKIYKKQYWDRARLDEVRDQKIADEIFVFGVNAGMERAIKKAQEVVGVKQDGIVGPKTLKALNNFDADLFDVMFDVEEVKYYKELIAKNSERFKRFEKGWINRAKTV